MSYGRTYPRKRTPGNGPTKAQTDYLLSLAEKLGIDSTEVNVRLGLTERTPWGVSSTGQTATRAAVSALIDRLKSQLENEG